MSLTSEQAQREVDVDHDAESIPVDAALVTAAWRVLERSGYRSLKIRQVLTASHSSASAFYRRFPSKAHLLLALLRAESERSTQLVAELLDRTEDARDQLEVWLQFHIEVLFDERRRSRALMFSDPVFIATQPAAIREQRSSLCTLLVEIVRRGAQSGVFDRTDPDGAAQAIYQLVRGLVYDPLTTNPTDSFDEVLRRTKHHALRLLGAETHPQ